MDADDSKQVHSVETHDGSKRVAIVGGGAAGYFAALACAEAFPQARISIFESSSQTLAKVRISGGGRCNVTFHCFEPRELVRHYPRGQRELLGPFSRFQPRDTIAWFEHRGVKLKTEPDGRVFPETNRASTITDCLERCAAEARVVVRRQTDITGIERDGDGLDPFALTLSSGACERFAGVLLATGGGSRGHRLAERLGHRIVDPVPSLFTFRIDDARLAGLSGTAFPDARLCLVVEKGKEIVERGPVLITHWGLSGPAVLRLSARGARALAEHDYRGELRLDLSPEANFETVIEELRALKTTHPKGAVCKTGPACAPRRYWRRLVEVAGLAEDAVWANGSKKLLVELSRALTGGLFQVQGRGVFKEEFVTCGGVALQEVNMKTMASRVCPGLFFAGEILDIDGLTGGFNFQCAWTTGWLAGRHILAPDRSS